MWGAKGATDLVMALFMAVLMRSTGTGKMTVLLFSAEMLLRVCRYRSCRINMTGRISWGNWQCKTKLYFSARRGLAWPGRSQI